MNLMTTSSKLLGVFCLCLVQVWIVAAQDYRGKVQGTVSDPSGTAMPAAKIVLHNTATGVEAVTTSNSSGHYLFDLVPPGTYSVAAEMQGFSRYVQENVSVGVQGDVTVDVSLSIGRVETSVTVTEAPTAVKFNTATTGTEIAAETVAALPQQERDPFHLALMDPSLKSQYNARSDEPFTVWGATSIQVPGTQARTNEVLLDGSSIKAGSMTSYVPNPDAVQQVVVTLNSADAEEGFSGGGTIAVVSKSGTNEFHGSALFMGRNPALEGKTYISNTPNLDRRKIENVSVGNPILKNRLFTFNSYEHWGYTSDNQISGRMPTDLERQGNFSQTLTAAGALKQIYDPASTVLNTANNTETRIPFAGNIIPETRLDPTAMRMMADIWSPNRAPQDPSGTNNFIEDTPADHTYWNFMDRTDWIVNDKLKIFGRYGKYYEQVSNYGTGSIAEANSTDGNSQHTNNFAADALYTINANTALDVTVAYTYIDQLFKSDRLNMTYQQFADLWGGNNWAEPYYGSTDWLRFPQLNIGSGAPTFGRSTGWLQHGHYYSLAPKLMRSQGKHYLKIGGEWRKESFQDGWPVGPSFNFSANDTANTGIAPNTQLYGDGYASFLMGALNSGSAPSNTTLHPQEWILGSYIQDDYKVSSRVTLQLGLRIDKDSGPYEQNNQIMRYIDLNAAIPALAAANPQLPAQAQQLRQQYGIADPTWTGAAVYASSSHRQMFTTPVAIQPRIGVALRLDDKTSLRGSYSRFTVPAIDIAGTLQQPVGMGGSYGYTAYGYAVSTSVVGPLQNVPQTYLNNPFPNGLQPIAGNSLGVYSGLGQSILWNNQNFKTPYNDRFTVSFQRELPYKVVAEAMYLFSHGNNQQPYGSDDGQTFQTNYELVNPMISSSLGSTLSTSVPNPFYNLLPANQMPGALGTQKNVSLGQLVSPYPYYTGLAQMGMPGMKSITNDLSFKLTRNMANGLLATFQYVYLNSQYQNFLGNTMEQYENNPEWDSDLRPRHYIAIITVAQLPFGRGRHFFRNANRPTDLLIGGWNFSANYQWHSGDFITFGDVVSNGNPAISNPSGEQWFNTAMIYPKVQPYTNPYALRTAPVYYPGLTGPGFWNLDATLSKSFRLTERFSLEFRLEAYNATNTWLQPDPNTNPQSPFFGQIVSTATPQSSARTTQYQLRLNF